MKKQASTNIFPDFQRKVTRLMQETRQRHRGIVLWMTGLSGSGKSTLATLLESHFFEQGCNVVLLDGDHIRAGLNGDLGFSAEDRQENIRRIAEVAHLFSETGHITICAIISPLRAMREMARGIIGAEDFMEVFIDAPLEVCEQRDVKGLYKMARSGEIASFTGISDPFEAPDHPDVLVNTHKLSISESITLLIDQIERRIRL